MPSSEEFTPQHPPVQDNAPLFVSLYTVLLAFFILLNSIAAFDVNKMEQAVSSVVMAFSIDSPNIQTPDAVTDMGKDFSFTQFFNEMKTVAAGFIPVDDLETYTYGNLMKVTFPVEDMFEARSAELKGINKSFLNGIVASVQRWSQKHRIELEAVLITRQDTSALAITDTEETRLAVQRVGVLARFFSSKGLEGSALSPGLQAGGKELLSFTFVVRDLDNSALEIQTPEDGDTPVAQEAPEAKP